MPRRRLTRRAALLSLLALALPAALALLPACWSTAPKFPPRLTGDRHSRHRLPRPPRPRRPRLCHRLRRRHPRRQPPPRPRPPTAPAASAPTSPSTSPPGTASSNPARKPNPRRLRTGTIIVGSAFQPIIIVPMSSPPARGGIALPPIKSCPIRSITLPNSPPPQFPLPTLHPL